MARLLALFILVPAVELFLLLEIGKRIGLPATVALIVVTGALGAYLARRQGLGVLAKLRERRAHSVAMGEILDGVIILLAGAVLITPGLLTDLFGFFCLTPYGRGWVKRFLERRFQSAVARGDAFVGVGLGDTDAGREPMRDVTPRDVSPRDQP